MKEEHEYLTKEKFEEFTQELNQLKTVRRKEVAENLEHAKALGDLSENAEYHEARDMQASVEDRIAKLEMILKTADIISTHDTSVASVGSAIIVQKDGDKEKKVIMLVGSEESDMSTGKVSLKSPFGMAVYGKKKGESFSFTTPSGTMTYKVIDIK